MISRQDLADLYAQINEAAEDFLWSDLLEWWHENAIHVAIVFVFLCGLGSCTVFMGKAVFDAATREPEAAATSADAGKTERSSGRNPWSLQTRPPAN